VLGLLRPGLVSDTGRERRIYNPATLNGPHAFEVRNNGAGRKTRPKADRRDLPPFAISDAPARATDGSLPLRQRFTYQANPNVRVMSCVETFFVGA
jgi:hypothetical protein